KISGSITIPAPRTHCVPGYKHPDGTRCVMICLPSTTRVWPALLPPANRATTWASRANTSTTLPLPSSPHWAPTTTSVLMLCSSQRFLRRRCSVVLAGDAGVPNLAVDVDERQFLGSHAPCVRIGLFPTELRI